MSLQKESAQCPDYLHHKLLYLYNKNLQSFKHQLLNIQNPTSQFVLTSLMYSGSKIWKVKHVDISLTKTLSQLKRDYKHYLEIIWYEYWLINEQGNIILTFFYHETNSDTKYHSRLTNRVNM